MSGARQRIATLAQAIDVAPHEARVVTMGRAPYQIVHTNKGWHEVTGYKFCEIANMTSSFLQGPDTEKVDERKLVGNLDHGNHTTVTLLNYSKDGMPFWNTLECFPLHDPLGNLTHYCGVIQAEPAPLDRFPPRQGLPPQLQMGDPFADARDSKASKTDGSVGTQSGNSSDSGSSNSSDRAISRRVTQERMGGPTDAQEARYAPHRPKRMRGQNVRLGDALANQKDAVVLTQPHPPYAITHVNQPWCEMCGYTQEEVEGLPNAILQGPETDQVILDDLMSSVARGEPTSATLINYKKGGTKFINQVQITPVMNEDDEIEQFMAMLHEVEGPVA